MSYEAAYRGLEREIALWGGHYLLVSTNAEVRRDGLPKVRQQPIDPGVAAWFYWRKQQRCIPCDRWDSIQGNINAIRCTVEAMRGIERWGTGEMLNRTAHVFAALPPTGAETPWHEVLGVPPTATVEQVKAAHIKAVKELHPDRGGDAQATARLNAARDRALQELRA
jgi:hypothetical protein